MTEGQKAQIRKYLGYPERFHQTRPELEMALSALETRPEGEAEVLAELAKAVDMDTRITSALARIKAAVVGSITLNPHEIPMLRSEGRRAVGRMASILGVPVLRDAFSGGGSRDNSVRFG